jgi:hypothetical protein
MADKQRPHRPPWPNCLRPPCYKLKLTTDTPRSEDAALPLHRRPCEPSSLRRRRHAALAAPAHGQVAMSHLWPSRDCSGMRAGLLPLCHHRSPPEHRPCGPEPRAGHLPFSWCPNEEERERPVQLSPSFSMTDGPNWAVGPARQRK